MPDTPQTTRRRSALPILLAAGLAGLLPLILELGALARTAQSETCRALANERRSDSLLEVEVREQRLVDFASPRPPTTLRGILLKTGLVPLAVPVSVSAGWSRFFNDFRTANRRTRLLLRLERAYGDVVGQASEWSILSEGFQYAGAYDSAAICHARAYGLYRLAGCDRQAVVELEEAGRAAAWGENRDTARALGLLRVALLHHRQANDSGAQAEVLASIGNARFDAENRAAAFDDFVLALGLSDATAWNRRLPLYGLASVLTCEGEAWFRQRCPEDTVADRLLAEVRGVDSLPPSG